MTTTHDALTVASRAWMVPHDAREKTSTHRGNPSARQGSTRSGDRASHWRRSVLIFDTETTIDTTQQLTFGCYRFGEWTRGGSLAIREEGFFHADNLDATDPDGYSTLKAFVDSHGTDATGNTRNPDLILRTQQDFLDDVLWPAFQQDALIVGFNLPFDLSRIACDVSPARGKHQGGFSFTLWDYEDETTGKRTENQFRPRVRITHIDSKRSRMDITQPNGRPKRASGKPIIYRPGFLDLRTLAFALTDRGYSLRSACEAFHVASGKAVAEEHGQITPDYIAYARQDVKASGLLLEALRKEYDRHPIDLDPCYAYSPASIAKAYFKTMGITPRLDAQPDFPAEILGYAMSAYYGGRAECGIRRTPVPVVYTDVLSMYPTVNANLKLWRFHTAETVVTEDCTADARRLLDSLTIESALDPATWKDYTFFAEIIPDGDVLPVRAKYSERSGVFNIGVNPFTDAKPHWYAGPDLIASTLLTGKAPNVTRAFRIVPMGRQTSLQPVKLRGSVAIDPTEGDFFQTVIEERKGLKRRTDLDETDRARLDKFLKVLANSGSYGIFVEMNPQDLPTGESVAIAVYGDDDEPFTASTPRPEEPGTYCFPPVASLITAGARLVLAIIERLITDEGGSHAFCDTDSMAIVATEAGGLIPCDGGQHHLQDGSAAIRALSWEQVDAILSRMDALNPYDRAIVRDAMLELEGVNFDDTGNRRELWCMSIAAKRYALFTRDNAGAPTILPESKRHGLGYLIDPRDDVERQREDLRPWELALWETIVRGKLGFRTEPLPWRDRPAVMRHSISTPKLLAAFDTVNDGKPYTDQIKPFNFMLAVSLDSTGRPAGINKGDRFSLITPYEANPKRWILRNWHDIYTGTPYQITTRSGMIDERTAQVKSLGNAADTYPWHPEPKRNGSDGTPCGKRTEGVLSRRPIVSAGQVCIGKEAHKVEERDIVAGIDELMNIFHDPRREPWAASVLPKLRAIATTPEGRKTLGAACGLSSRTLRNILSGRSRSRASVRAALTSLAIEWEGASERLCDVCRTPLEGVRANASQHLKCRERLKKRGKRGEMRNRV